MRVFLYRFGNTAMVLLLIAVSVYAGYNIRNDQVKAADSIPLPVVELTKYIEVPVEVEKIVQVEKIVTKTVIQEKIIPLSDFSSKSELEAFLLKDDSDKVVKITMVGSTPINNQCEDRVLNLILAAEKEGKRLHLSILTSKDALDLYKIVLPENSLHAICLAVIGNEGYYIEPSNDRVWWGFNLD